MDEEQALLKEINAGAKAKAVMESEAFRDAVERVQARIRDQFAESDPMDVAKLQAIRYEQKALADVVRELKTSMDSGTMASMQIVTLRDRAKKFFKIGG